MDIGVTDKSAKIAFRDCQSGDIERLQTIVDELYEDDIGDSANRPEIATTFALFAELPQCGRIIVFQNASEIVGYAILVFFWSNEYGGFMNEIDELAVVRAHRSRGVGSQFFDWLDQEPGERTAGWTLQVNRQNAAAIRLYEKKGFRRSGSDYYLRVRRDKPINPSSNPAPSDS